MRDGDFHVRGKEISRVAMRGFFAFAITFTMLFSVWRLQFAAALQQEQEVFEA
jgi:hypothetical protein